MIPALIGAIGGIMASGVAGSIGGQNQLMLANAQYQYQRRLAEQQASLNSRMWHDQFNTYNKYNDPSAVRARLAAAGLNPALAMSGGAAAAPQSSGSFSSTGVSQGQAMIPNATFPDITGLADSVQAFAGAKKNLEEAETESTIRALNTANTELAKAGVLTEKGRAAGLEIDNWIKDVTKFEMADRPALENALINSRISEVYKHIDDYVADINYKKARTQNERIIAQSTVKLQTSQALYYSAKIGFEGRLTRVQEKNCKAFCEYYGAQVAKIGIEADRETIMRDTEKEYKKALDTVIRRHPNLLYEYQKAVHEGKIKENGWKNTSEFMELFIHPVLKMITVPIPLG